MYHFDELGNYVKKKQQKSKQIVENKIEFKRTY